jgi:hypothetical protein
MAKVLDKDWKVCFSIGLRSSFSIAEGGALNVARIGELKDTIELCSMLPLGYATRIDGTATLFIAHPFQRYVSRG